MPQLILGTGTAIWWLTEPHYTQYRHYDDTNNDFTYNDFIYNDNTYNDCL